MVVTGLGVISPLGNEPVIFFDNLMAGKSGIKRSPDGAKAVSAFCRQDKIDSSAGCSYMYYATTTTRWL
ncbi:MAG: beta-ketoacyl synthase N-terminal-like domain-containing protein [Nitrososphaera sp.]